MDEAVKKYDRVIMGIDPGTNVMGYAVLGVTGKTPEMVVMGVIKLNKIESHYMRLARIYNRVLGLVEQYLPDELKNVQYYRYGDNKVERAAAQYWEAIKG